MDATIKNIHKSQGLGLYQFDCHACAGSNSSPEYTEAFTLVFTRQGNFTYQSFRSEFEVYNQNILLEKPGYVHWVKHNHQYSDQCLFIELQPDQLEPYLSFAGNPINQFIKDADRGAVLLPTSPAIELLHWQLIELNGKTAYDQISTELFMDQLIADVFSIDSNYTSYHINYQSIILLDKVKKLINTRFYEQLPLNQIADEACLSPFHFSRIFKNLTSFFSSRMAVEEDTPFKDEFSMHGTAFNTGIGGGIMLNPRGLLSKTKPPGNLWIILGANLHSGSATNYRFAEGAKNQSLDEGKYKSLTHYTDFKLGLVIPL